MRKGNRKNLSSQITAEVASARVFLLSFSKCFRFVLILSGFHSSPKDALCKLVADD